MSQSWTSPLERAKELLRASSDELGEEATEKACELLEHSPAMARAPRVQASAALYLAKIVNNDVTQQEVADHFGVSSHALRNAKDEIRDDLTADDLYEILLDRERPSEDEEQVDEELSKPERYKRVADKLRARTPEPIDLDEYEEFDQPEVTEDDTLADKQTEHARLYRLDKQWSVSHRETTDSVTLRDMEWQAVRQAINEHMNGDEVTTDVPTNVQIMIDANNYTVTAMGSDRLTLPGEEWLTVLEPFAE